MSDEGNLVVRVRRRFPEPRERVFDRWLEPRHARWFMFTAGTDALVRCDIDARPGGEFVMTDRRPGGDVEHRGTYLEIDRPERIVFSYGVPAITADRDVVTLTFSATDDGCEVTLETAMKPEWADYLDGARQAWQHMLAGLAATPV